MTEPAESTMPPRGRSLRNPTSMTRRQLREELALGYRWSKYWHGLYLRATESLRLKTQEMDDLVREVALAGEPLSASEQDFFVSLSSSLDELLDGQRRIETLLCGSDEPEAAEGTDASSWYAPFTDEQVIELNRWQRTGWVHPFTCGNDEHISGVALMPTTKGWVCPVGGCPYTQDWCHPFMADGSLPTESPIDQARAKVVGALCIERQPGEAHEDFAYREANGIPNAEAGLSPRAAIMLEHHPIGKPAACGKCQTAWPCGAAMSVGID